MRPETKNFQRLLQAEKRDAIAREEEFKQALLAHFHTNHQKGVSELLEKLNRNSEASQAMFARLEQGLLSSHQVMMATSTNHESRALVSAPAQGGLLTQHYSSNKETVSKTKWKKSDSDVAECNTLDLLDMAALRCGIVKWSIHVEGKAELRSGVVLSTKSNSNAQFGSQAGMWAYGSWGDAWYDGNRGWHRKYGAGSVVTFTLDLTCGGTLQAAVDGHDPEIIFVDMAKEMQMLVNAGTVGFIPAVCCKPGTLVQILGIERFEKVMDLPQIDQPHRWIEDAD